MRKRVLSVLIALLLCCTFLLACSGNNGESSQTNADDTPTSTQENADASGLTLIGQEVVSDDYGYCNVKYTVRNDTDTPINVVGLTINELDESNNIVGTTYPQVPTVVQPEQSLAITALHGEGVVSTQVIGYAYVIGTDPDGEFVDGYYLESVPFVIRENVDASTGDNQKQSATEQTTGTSSSTTSQGTSKEPGTSAKPKNQSTNGPSASVGESNALSSARSYLNYTAFSYSGLVEQLEFEGYTTEEAEYAADNCGADWNEQALEKAGEYLNYTSFSYSGLVEQLKFEGFTDEQAEYGVDNCGADWYDQAAKKAKEYIDYSSFSREGLIDQLVFEGFTYDQAEHGAASVGY